MTEKEYNRWVTGQMMLLIWNPEIWTFCRDKRMKRKNEVYYKAKGLVLHDRALNNRLSAQSKDQNV